MADTRGMPPARPGGQAYTLSGQRSDRTRVQREGRGSGGGAPGAPLDPGETPGQSRRASGVRPASAAVCDYPLSEATLADLGLATAGEWASELERRHMGRAADQVRQDDKRRRALPSWAHLLPATRTGTPRAVRLELCGLAMPYRTAEGDIAWDRRGCRDRACPVCSAQRSRRIAAELREVVDLARGPVYFITLTQPRRPREEPVAAVDRLLATWRHLLRRERGRGVVLGGYRAVEVTARHGAGLHAHLHCLVELSPDAAPGHDAPDGGYVLARWLQVAAGAVRAAQDAQPVTFDNIYQCAKYPEDTSGLADIAAEAPGYCRRVLAALVARRTGEAFGSWRERLRAVRERSPEHGRWYGDAAVRSVALGRSVVRWAGGGCATGAEVLGALGRWPGEVAPAPAPPPVPPSPPPAPLPQQVSLPLPVTAMDRLSVYGRRRRR